MREARLGRGSVAERGSSGGAGGVLPLMVNLMVDNCPRLFRDQREALGDLALQLSQRRNFGFFSLYTTEVGASGLLAQLPLPRYSLETLAVAGQFIVLRAESVD